MSQHVPDRLLKSFDSGKYQGFNLNHVSLNLLGVWLQQLMNNPVETTKFGNRMKRRSRIGVPAIIFIILIMNARSDAVAGECPAPSSAIATDRPDVTNSSLVIPSGSLQIENGLNTTGRGYEKTFDGTNSRVRLGVAPCLEVLVDLPNYFGALRGPAGSGFSNVVPAVKWQFSSLPEQWDLSVTAGMGLPTGATKIAGYGVQPYLQLPWSHELGGGWGTSGMVTTFFFPGNMSNKLTTEVTLVLEKKVTERGALFVEYVGDYPSHGGSVELVNLGGSYLLTRTQQIDIHVAFGINGNSPNYIFGIGYSLRFDHLFDGSSR